jgi:hypothetical protein
MWIAIPEARTVHQKFAMRGEKPDLSNIQRNIEMGSRTVGRNVRRASRNSAPVFNDIFRVISKIFAVILVLFAIGGILLFTFLFLGIEIFNGFNPGNIMDYVALGMENTFWLKLSSLAFIFLPLLGMLYGGIQILFEFRNPRFRPGLIIFFLWIIAGVTSITLAVKSSRPYWEDSREAVDVPIMSKSDTIYLKLMHSTPMPDNNLIIDGDRDELTMIWMDKSGSEKSFVVFPKIRVMRSEDDSSRYIKMRTQSFGFTGGEAMIKAQRNLPAYELTDSLLVIRPDVYSKRAKWDGTNKRITIYVPDNVKIILKDPIRFGFDGDLEIHSGFNYLRHPAPFRPW